jgi:hypothetical protein
VAVYATPTSSDGHARFSAKTNSKLTFHTDHSMGGGQFRYRLSAGKLNSADRVRRC